MQGINKKEVEVLLGSSITDSMFQEALGCARRKQEYIYQREGREVVMQRWYLVKLVEEYVKSLAFSKFTMDLCEALRNMEKERPEKTGTHQTQPYCSISSRKNQA